MSNEIISTTQGRIPAAFISPAMTLALSKAIESVTDPHPDTGTPGAFPWPVQHEARTVGEVYHRAVQPVPETHLRAWVMPVITSAYVATGKDRSDEDLNLWIGSLQLGVGHLGIGAFTMETQRLVLDRIRFFPFVADIYDIVAPPAVKIRTTFDALKRIILAPAAQPPPATPGDRKC